MDQAQEFARFLNAPFSVTRWRVALIAEVGASHAGPPWGLFRQDDHGNQLLMQKRATRVEAELLADQFEARGHKQTYWVERLPGG